MGERKRSGEERWRKKRVDRRKIGEEIQGNNRRR